MSATKVVRIEEIDELLRHLKNLTASKQEITKKTKELIKECNTVFLRNKIPDDISLILSKIEAISEEYKALINDYVTTTEKKAVLLITEDDFFSPNAFE